MKIPIPILLAALMLAAFFGFKQEAEASPTERMMAVMSSMPANPTMAVWNAYAQQAAAVGPGYVDSAKVTCDALELIQAPGVTTGKGLQISYACQTPLSTETGGTVLVGVGDSGITDPAFATRTTPVYSGDTVREWGGNARQEYCRADAGSVDIFCRFLVTYSGAP